MKKVVLVFPKMEALFTFLSIYDIPKDEVNVSEKHLVGCFDDNLVETACTKFRAIVRTWYPKLSS